MGQLQHCIPDAFSYGVEGACLLKSACCARCVGWCPVVSGCEENWCVMMRMMMVMMMTMMMNNVASVQRTE